MNINTTRTARPSAEPVSAIDWDLENSGHAWAVDAQVAHSVDALADPNAIVSTIDAVVRLLYGWGIAGARKDVAELVYRKFERRFGVDIRPQ